MSIDLALHPKQANALLTLATEILYGGSAGSGKSHLFRAASILWCTEIKGLQVYIFRRTFPDLFRNHIEGPSSFPALLQPWIEEGWCKFNWSKNKIEFWNGSVIHLNHCQYAKDIWSFQGAEIHVLIIDELTQWEKDMYTFLRGRVRMAGIELPEKYKGQFPKILTGSNPGGIGHNWVKAMFIDSQPAMKLRRTPAKEGGMLRQFIPALMQDNPTLMNDDPQYLDRLEGLGDKALVEAMKSGNWDIVAGGMFDDVWDKSKHVIPAFDIPTAWHIDRSFDWGSSKPFSVGWWAESDGTEIILYSGERYTFPRGTLFRIAEWYGWNGEPNEGCKMLATEIARGIKEKELAMGLGNHVKPGPADSSIWNIENGKSIEEDMRLLNVKWKKANKSPGSRKLGWEQLRKRLKNVLDKPDEPGLYVFDNCVHFIRTVPVLPRDNRDRDDVDTDAEDHVADETRYRVLAPKIAEVHVRKLSGA